MVIAADLFAALLGLLAIAAVGTAVLAGRKAQSIIGQALASAIVVTVLFYLYTYSVGGAESQVIRAGIILLALSWELMTSGSNLNPDRENKIFPRASRVFMFVGYLLLVATCVFVFNEPQRLATGDVQGSFDTEMMVANALATFGSALILSRALRQWSNLWGHDEPALGS
jgi:hypothetical protein